MSAKRRKWGRTPLSAAVPGELRQRHRVCGYSWAVAAILASWRRRATLRAACHLQRTAGHKTAALGYTPDATIHRIPPHNYSSPTSDSATRALRNIPATTIPQQRAPSHKPPATTTPEYRPPDTFLQKNKLPGHPDATVSHSKSPQTNGRHAPKYSDGRQAVGTYYANNPRVAPAVNHARGNPGNPRRGVFEP